MSRKAVMAVSLAAWFVISALSNLALANPFGTAGSSCAHYVPCWYDGTKERYWYDSSLGSQWVDASEYARTHFLNPTDLATTNVAAHADSDVAVYIYNDPNDILYGYSDCISWTGVLCGHWHEYFNSAFLYKDTKRESLACHEFGHTTGLYHYANHLTNPSCMEVPHFHLDYNAHDLSHINDRY